MTRAIHAVLALALGTFLLITPHHDPVTPVATTTITLDGVPVRWDPTIRQVITVNRTSGSYARVSFYQRGYNGSWYRQLQTTQGRIGYGGLVQPDQRRQGTGTTPLGTYALPFTFGNTAKWSTWDMEFRRVESHHYWVQDNASAHYNRWRSRNDGGFRWWLPASDPNSSERLADYPTQYEMAAVVGYNYYGTPVRYRGSGIFLHVNGAGATAGCVSVPRAFMAGVMVRLLPGQRPHIAIGW